MHRAALVGMMLSLGIAAVFLPQSAFACSCAAVSQKDAFDYAKAVFVGRVISVDKSGMFGKQYRTVRFEVSETWKGPAAHELTVTTGMGGGDCGYNFAEGEPYLVYANAGTMYGGELETGICSRTETVRHAGADIEALGSGESVPLPQPTSFQKSRDAAVGWMRMAPDNISQYMHDVIIVGPWYGALFFFVVCFALIGGVVDVLRARWKRRR